MPFIPGQSMCSPQTDTARRSSRSNAEKRPPVWPFFYSSSPRLELVRGYIVLSTSGNKGFGCPTLPD